MVETRRGLTTKLPYKTMPLEAFAALPVSDLAEPAAHLYVWTTNRFLEEAYGIVRGWGFRPPAQLLTWCKPPMGVGFGGAFTTTTEFVVFARRGTLARRPAAGLVVVEVVTTVRDGYIAHSAKPDDFLDLVEQVSPSPRLEMFARRQRLGWDTGQRGIGTRLACGRRGFVMPGKDASTQRTGAPKDACAVRRGARTVKVPASPQPPTLRRNGRRRPHP